MTKWLEVLTKNGIAFERNNLRYTCEITSQQNLTAYINVWCREPTRFLVIQVLPRPLWLPRLLESVLQSKWGNCGQQKPSTKSFQSVWVGH